MTVVCKLWQHRGVFRCEVESEYPKAVLANDRLREYNNHNILKRLVSLCMIFQIRFRCDENPYGR